ncbi:MAG TPA: glycosyltransferase family 4 protein, partial [Candidatus Nanoarchaeia archaeon]|nr:glycosyltransferase family 4 protein [Candidatus Nanoarchaeia archaeon]
MTTTFYPPHVGGIEYHVQNLSKELAKKGHAITVLTSTLPGQRFSTYEKDSDEIEIIRLKTIFPRSWPYPSVGSQGFALNVGSVIKKIAREKNIDVIHAHGHHYYFTWRTLKAAKSERLPSVLTIHGLNALNPTDPLAEIGEEIFNRIIFRTELDNATSTIGLTPA